ncbi:hypothetical protein DFH29DRAFT_878604 [Suillus ampliporus]|nr:hypothetical protein DFH29DRAFT_878604 [Suillus ampliporus]
MYWPKYEYGAVVVECLACQNIQVSSRERMKMVRKDQKMHAVLDKRNLDICVSASFTFKNNALNGLMLDKAGIVNDSSQFTVMNLHLEGRYNKSSEYFNLPDTGLDLGDIKNAKIQFEVLPLDDKEKDCPASAIGYSQWRKPEMHDASAVPSNLPFWHTYKEDNKYSLVVMAGAIFHDVPDVKTATTPRLSRAEATKCPGLMSQSKVRASTKRYTQALGENEGKKSRGHWWHNCDLEDSKGQYSALLNTYDLRGTRFQSPDVWDEHGIHIHLFVILIFHSWTIKPHNNPSNPCDANGSDVYQMMLQHMQLLPCKKYMQASFVDLFKDGKGKRKAVDKASEAMGQSPTKKGAFSAVLGDKLEHMEE